MPTIFTFFGLRFVFFSNDHEPIHIHVIKGKGKIVEFAKFQVVPEIKLLENKGLKSSELKIAEAIIEGKYRRNNRKLEQIFQKIINHGNYSKNMVGR